MILYQLIQIKLVLLYKQNLIQLLLLILIILFNKLVIYNLDQN